MALHSKSNANKQIINIPIASPSENVAVSNINTSIITNNIEGIAERISII